MSENRLLFECILDLDESWNRGSYKSVNKWLRAVRRRGDKRSTKLAYLKWLSYFLRFLNLTEDENHELGDRHIPIERRKRLIAKVRKGLNPDRLIKLSRKSLTEKVQAFCDKYNEAGKARTAHLALNYLRSFFKHNGIDELDLDDYNWRKSKKFEYVPTKEEVYKMADQSDARRGAILLCAFQSGLRNSTIRALCYGDFREQFENERIPIRIHVNSKLRERIPEACKEDAEYFTFLGKEAVEALKEYVEWRVKKYGKISDDEPLFLPYEAFSQKPEGKTHLSEDSLQRMIKRAARRARIKEWRHIRFHSLRKTFRAVLDAGYIDGGQMAEDDKEYLMGHRIPSSKEPYHNVNVDALAQRYVKLNWSLTSQVTKEMKVEMIKAFAKSLGIEKLDIRIQKMKKEQPELDEIEALGRILRKELGIKPLETKTVKNKKTNENSNPNNCRRYETKIVSEGELVPYLDEGWDIVKELKNTKIVIRKSIILNDLVQS